MKRYNYACKVDEEGKVVYSKSANYSLTARGNQGLESSFLFEENKDNEYFQIWVEYIRRGTYGFSIKTIE